MAILTDAERQEIASIINGGLDKTVFDFNIEHIAWQDIKPENSWLIESLITFEDDRNPVSFIFNELSKNRYKDFGQFNHFKSVSRALDIITNKEIQVSNLFSNQENDFAEYTELYKRIGLFHQLTPVNYADLKAANKFDPSAPTPADLERETIFVLCLTQDNHNQKFWRTYAADSGGNPDHGVSIGFRFSNFNDSMGHLYDLRDVFYDSGYDFDFLNHINFHLSRRFGRIIFSEGLVKFAKFYKRGGYKWENETRLCFHYDGEPLLGIGEQLESIFPVQMDAVTNRKYINLPLATGPRINPFFDLTITEVACGKNVSKDDFEKLESALRMSYPKAYIWQRI